MRPYEGKSEVDMGHLIRVVIPKQYSFDIRTACLIELVANSLDAKPTFIDIRFDDDKGVLEVTDDGVGMNEQSFRDYHNVSSPKITGTGIGFAGQGAKLALNFCSKVVSETFSSSYKGYSEWHLESEAAPYRIFDGHTLDLKQTGTKVTLYLDDESRKYYTIELIIKTIEEHYFPLLDEKLLLIYTGQSPILVDGERSLTTYKPIYKIGLKIIVNGKEIVREPLQNVLEKQKRVSIKVFTRPKAQGFFGLTKYEIDENTQGIAVCSFGKVIERTWFRKEPHDKRRITGWIEAPYLIEAVTTDKCGFQRGNKTWEGFFRRAQADFAKWLEEIGLSERPTERKPDLSNLEKEINSILRNLPELTFFGTRTERHVAIPDEMGEQRELGEGTQKVSGTVGGETSGQGVSVYPGDEPGQGATLNLGEGVKATPHQRTIRGGVQMSPVWRDDIQKEAWFDGETIFINEAHPAYERAKRERLDNYHLLKTAVFSLIEFKLQRDPEPSYQEAFELSQRFFRLWGEQ